MKSKIGPAKLRSDVLFRIAADAPPAHIRTTAEILRWQASEHQRMLDEATRLLHEQLLNAFSEFMCQQEGVPN